MELVKRSYSKATTELRGLLKEGTHAVPGVYNPFTALLAERVGFKAIYLSGAALTGSLAMPDLGLLTLTELSFYTRLIASTVRIPLIVDADTGFGEVINIARAVRELEGAGASAMQIEDQEMPKKCGHLAGKRVIDADEMMKKIAAAVEARRDDDFVIIARTDARSVYGLNDAIERAKAYVEAGADVIFPEALESEAEFAEFAKQVNAPLLANMTEFGKTPYISLAKFKELGYRLVIFPVTLFRVAARATEEALRELMSKGTQVDMLERMMSRSEFYEIIGYKQYEEFDSRIASKSIRRQRAI